MHANPFQNRPYLDWTLDRLKFLVAFALFVVLLAVLLIDLRDGGRDAGLALDPGRVVIELPGDDIPVTTPGATGEETGTPRPTATPPADATRTTEGSVDGGSVETPDESTPFPTPAQPAVEPPATSPALAPQAPLPTDGSPTAVQSSGEDNVAIPDERAQDDIPPVARYPQT